MYYNNKVKNKENKREKLNVTTEKKKQRRIKKHQRRSCLRETATIILVNEALSLFTENRQLLFEISKAERRRLI